MEYVSLSDDLAELLAQASGGIIAEAGTRKEWNDDELVSLGMDLDMGTVTTLAMVLKNQWESNGSKTPDSSRTGGDVGERGHNAPAPGFDPDTSALFRLFKKHGCQEDFTEAAFDELVRQIILANLHRASVTSPELKIFIQRGKTTQGLLETASAEQLEKHWIVKSKWLELSEKFNDLLLTIENQRLTNARINQKFLVKYGKEFFELQEQLDLVMALQLRIELKESDPGLTSEALDELVARQEKEAKKALEKMRALSCEIPLLSLPEGADVLSPEEVLDYEKKCKEVLRSIWVLLHPDKLTRHPAYPALTKNQKNRLRELWNDVLKIRPGELVFAPGQLGYGRRTLEILLQARQEAEAVLAAAGIDLDVHLLVEGNTVDEQIKWYEREVLRLEADIINTRARLKALLDNLSIEERRTILGVPAYQQEKIKREMKGKARQYREMTRKLQVRMSDLLGERGV